MTKEQEIMRDELLNSTFKFQLKKALESGLLLFAKYGLILLLTYIALSFVSNLIAGANNGTQAALYINQVIEKGYLPKAINGQIPPKEEHEKTSSSSSTPK